LTEGLRFKERESKGGKRRQKREGLKRAAQKGASSG